MLDYHGRCFSPIEEMKFYHGEMKFYVSSLYLDIPTKTTKLLHQKLLDQKMYTSFQDGIHVRLSWPLFGLHPLFNP